MTPELEAEFNDACRSAADRVATNIVPLGADEFTRLVDAIGDGLRPLMERLAKDTERLDWLESTGGISLEQFSEDNTWTLDDGHAWSDTLREAIDEAREGQT